VTTNPALSATIAVDGIDRDDWGLTWVKIPAGSHIVQFRGVYGYTTPAPIPVTITHDVTTEEAGNYVRHGSLRVMTNPAVSSTVFVANIPRDDWGMWQSMPPGSYRVTFGPVPGYITPAGQTAVVTAGGSITITGTFTIMASPSAPASATCCMDSCCDCDSACHPHGS